MRTTGGQRLLTATLPGGKLPASCGPAARQDAPAPELEAAWFPKDLPRKASARCGLHHAYQDGTTLYAWATHQDWVDAGAP